jgi:hypothetical protein
MAVLGEKLDAVLEEDAVRVDERGQAVQDLVPFLRLNHGQLQRTGANAMIQKHIFDEKMGENIYIFYSKQRQ